MYQHHGILYPTAVAAITEAIYDYVTAMGKNTTREAQGLANAPAERLKADLESLGWAPGCGDLADWQAARLDVISRLKNEF